ncbi:hypothetical protein [Gemmata sp.]|uniref:hypothetical protein n=1 Tax=Gemmata sp. TaxID=1914242 RepID=UPI003F726773
MGRNFCAREPNSSASSLCRIVVSPAGLFATTTASSAYTITDAGRPGTGTAGGAFFAAFLPAFAGGAGFFADFCAFFWALSASRFRSSGGSSMDPAASSIRLPSWSRRSTLGSTWPLTLTCRPSTSRLACDQLSPYRILSAAASVLLCSRRSTTN